MTTLSVSDVIIGKYTLSVTTRDGGDTPDMLSELTYRTIKAWLWIVSRLEQGETMLPLTNEGDTRGSVEQGLHNEFIETDAFMFPSLECGDARVTVWDTFKSQSRISFHLNSDDIPQIAVNVWAANHKAIERILSEHPQNTPQSHQDAPNSSTASPQASTIPAAPTAPVDGVIVATRAPNPNQPSYADGQLVSYTITKIAASSNQGSATFQLWSPLGQKYPTHTVYKTSKKGENTKDYEAIIPVLNTTGLSFEKPEAIGTWRLVCKIAHGEKDGKPREYHNVVSLTAI